MELTPKQQTSEAIRQAETILILSGQHPSVDQAAAVLALAAILRKFGKKVTPIISDNPPASVTALEVGGPERGAGGSRDFVLKLDVTKTEVDKLRYEVADGKLNIYLTPFKGSFAPSDVTFGYSGFQADLAIVLGVPTRARIDRFYDQNASSFENIPVVNLDFHRSNENYGAVNLIEPNASSLCEMLVALSESLQSGIIDAEIATALLMGIVASTDRFTAAHTSPKSLTVAAQMMAAGAHQQAVVRALFRDSKGDKGGEKGGERSERERGERGGERERGERGGERERGADRDRAQQRNQPQSGSQNRPEPQSKPEPQNRPEPQSRPEQPAHQPQQPAAQQPQPAQQQPQPEQAPVREEPMVPQGEPMTALASVAAISDEPAMDPIIPPSHIEMSQMEHVQDQATEHQPQPQRSQAMPSADFARAAEMFSHDNLAAADPTPDREQS